MEQQFSLSWNNFHGNLTKGFTGLLGKGEFVDVTIAVEGHLLQAHKVILSICSPYFKKMFQMNPCQHPIVVLRDVTHKAMKDLLQFMYHGEVSVKQEDLTSFIGTAEVLQIKGLTTKEGDEDENDKTQETPLQSLDTQSTAIDTESCISDTCDSDRNDIQNNELHLLKQREFIEKLQRLGDLKRKSEETHKNYYSGSLLNTEKRPKLKDKSSYNEQNSHILTASNNYDNMKSIYNERPVDVTSTYNTFAMKPGEMNNKEVLDDAYKDRTICENSIEMKTECDTSDIIVTDPAVCTTPKNYDGSKDGQKDSLSLGYHSPQDNCTSLNSLFINLKNLVNGKNSNNALRNNTFEEFPPCATEHRLVTIPQKEDGKKKYPQRSCRLCWKIGKRRDTRFMCNVCELPFCKSPCFEIHFNDVLKVIQLQGDYYAT